MYPINNLLVTTSQHDKLREAAERQQAQEATAGQHPTSPIIAALGRQMVRIGEHLLEASDAQVAAPAQSHRKLQADHR